MTKKQLRTYVSDYADAFADWNSIDGCAFARSAGPLRQMVDFENLRSGAYRPSTSISTTVGPKIVLHHQFLDVKHKEILPSEHRAMRSRVLQAMQEQFRPSIHERLDPELTIRMCEDEAVGTLNDCAGLAASNAYLGHLDRALRWCVRLREAVDALGRRPVNWEKGIVKFGETLRTAIEAGNAHEFLNTVGS